MFFLRDKKKVQKAHRVLASHHVNDNKVKNPVAAVIDWECSRLTKPESQRNARDTFNEFYPNVDGIEETLIELGL